MADIPPTNPDLPPLSRLDRVDRACDRFEDAWSAPIRPRIEDYLAEAPAADRPELLKKLVALEVELRRMSGEPTEGASYFARFPDYACAIGSAFGESSFSADFRLASPETQPGPGGGGHDEFSPPPTLGPLAGLAASHVEALPTGKILGDYELLDILGQGGMGVVYRAWQRGADRVVALKLIQPGWLVGMPAERIDEAIALFLGEARMAARLEHANIVTIYDVGRVDGRPYYSMKCVVGSSLAEILRDGPLPDARAAALLEPVARAVEHANERNILHRDLKPANILVDKEGRPFVADFGLAKLLEAPQATSRSLGGAGTPPYMSPEQARNSPEVGPASDVYSLGATLYEMLTGRPPFRAAGHRETLQQVLRAEPVPPRRLNPEIGRDLEAICLKCLEKDPRSRYPGAGALADDLQRWKSGLTPAASPCGPASRFARWARRRPAGIATAAVVVAVVLGLGWEVRRLTIDLSLVAALNEHPPHARDEAARDRHASRRSEAAVELARRGRGDLIPPIFSRHGERRLRRAILARIARMPEGSREALLRAFRLEGTNLVDIIPHAH